MFFPGGAGAFRAVRVANPRLTEGAETALVSLTPPDPRDVTIAMLRARVAWLELEVRRLAAAARMTALAKGG